MSIRTVVSLLAFVASLVAGCNAAEQSRPPVKLTSFVLADVQGLSGGQAIWATHDGTAFVQLVGHEAGQNGLWERRYKRQLTPAQWGDVERLVAAHNLLGIKMPQRPGVPDEAHPTISLVTQSGTAVSVGKWANDKHPDFDQVYEYLLSLCRPEGELLREGAFDWVWRPAGFP
jgi:hypothetical protein